jgi:hypothetical protein
MRLRTVPGTSGDGSLFVDANAESQTENVHRSKRRVGPLNMSSPLSRHLHISTHNPSRISLTGYINLSIMQRPPTN